MSIREYSRQVGHIIVGKMTAVPRPEWDKNDGFRLYRDEIGNEYYISGEECRIVTVWGYVY